MPAISVLIPTHGRPILLERALRSLAECRLPAVYRETVVVENGSRAGAETVVAETAAEHSALRLRYMHVERANKSHALNEALTTIDEGLVVFFDDDVRLDPGVLEAYAEAVAKHPENAFFGGSVEIDYEEPPEAWLLPLLGISVRGYDLSEDERPNMYLGFNWAAYLTDLSAVGGFDDHLGPGSKIPMGDEPELQNRLSKAGVIAVDVPNAWVSHYVPRERCSKKWAGMRRRYAGLSLSYRALKRGEKRSTLIKWALIGMVRECAKIMRSMVERNKTKSWLAMREVIFHWSSLWAVVTAPSPPPNISNGIKPE